ncbi:MAG: hypothetical protein ACM3P1_04660 [Candidatus Saccharibacteria bacterium]
MKKLTTILILLFALSFLPSCEKDNESESDITIIENQLKSFVNENNIDKFNIFLISGSNTSYLYSYEAKYVTIQNGFLIIKTEGTNERLNLLYLSRFELMGNKTIALYFPNTLN